MHRAVLRVCLVKTIFVFLKILPIPFRAEQRDRYQANYTQCSRTKIGHGANRGRATPSSTI
jgi:hypothetical protein